MKQSRVFHCPTCGKEVALADLWFPFCRERCRLIDLGRWLEEDHRLPGEPAGQEEPEELGGSASMDREQQ